MPHGNFIDRWVAYASERTESPEIFHKYMAYTAVSVTLGNRAWLPWTNGKLFPNLYILFLSESASYKSSAISMIKDVIDEVDEGIEAPHDCTSASLANTFKKYKQGFIPVDEFEIILKAEEGHFSTVKTMLTSVYDCPRKYRLPYRVSQDIEGDKKFVEHPVFSLAAAITPHTFVKNASIEDLKGGFLSRFITVPGKKPKRSIPTPPGVDWGLIRSFAESLKRLRDPLFWDKDRPAEITDGARRIRSEWYNQVKDLMDTDPNYIEMANSVNRIRTYALKFALLHSIAEGKDHLVEEDDILEGIEISNTAILSLFRCMSNLEVTCSKDKSVKNIEQARETLRSYTKENPATKTILYKAIRHLYKRDADQIISTLADRKEIKIDYGPNGHQSIWWTGD
jgi:hypothetical protein